MSNADRFIYAPSERERDEFALRIVSNGDCWTWIGGFHEQGYGKWTASNVKTGRSHRIAYLWTFGLESIADGLQLDHLCRNRACVNPDHLEPVTQRENKRRGNSTAAVNARKTHCIRGHDLSEEMIIAATGKRRCYTCVKLLRAANPEPQRQAARRYREKHPYVRVTRSPKTVCDRGHAYTPENSRPRPDGGVSCRTCQRELQKARRAIKRAVAFAQFVVGTVAA